MSIQKRQEEQIAIQPRKSGFKKDLEHLINCCCKENGSDTPDFILAEYLVDCLQVFDKAVKRRTEWYGLDKRDLRMEKALTEGRFVLKRHEGGDK